MYLWEAALLINEGDDVEWFCCQQVEDLLVVCELNVLPPDVFLVILRLEGGGTREVTCIVYEVELKIPGTILPKKI